MTGLKRTRREQLVLQKVVRIMKDGLQHVRQTGPARKKARKQAAQRHSALRKTNATLHTAVLIAQQQQILARAIRISLLHTRR